MINWQEVDWQGAELNYYYNDESYGIGLSDVQFLMISKILGLKLNHDGTITCFSDETLKKMFKMKSNPLNLQEDNTKEV